MIPIQDLISTGLFNLCRCQGLETCRVYPWTQQFVNTISGHDVTRASSFPDLDPSSLPRNAQFSMAAGDFLEVSNSFPILSFKGNSIIYHLVDCWMRSTCIHFALPCIWFLCAQCHILVFFFFFFWRFIQMPIRGTVSPRVSSLTVPTILFRLSKPYTRYWKAVSYCCTVPSSYSIFFLNPTRWSPNLWKKKFFWIEN